jgi:hypothetical protein
LGKRVYYPTNGGRNVIPESQRLFRIRINEKLYDQLAPIFVLVVGDDSRARSSDGRTARVGPRSDGVQDMVEGWLRQVAQEQFILAAYLKRQARDPG